MKEIKLILIIHWARNKEMLMQVAVENIVNILFSDYTKADIVTRENIMRMLNGRDCDEKVAQNLMKL